MRRTSTLIALLFAATPALAQPADDDGLPPPTVSSYGAALTGGAAPAADTSVAASAPAATPPAPAVEQPVRRVDDRRSIEGRHGASALLGHYLNGEELPALGRFDAVYANPVTFGQRLAVGGFEAVTGNTQAHLDAIRDTGVGRYYGDHGSYARLSPEERRAWIEEHATPGTTPPAPVEASCIGWAMENVRAAYEAAGRLERWREIERRVIAEGARGTVLAQELQKDGWEAVYWNPDARNPSDGDTEHSYSAFQVSRGKPYYGVRVDHQVLNYRPSRDSETAQDLSGLAKLAQVPFWFGLARGGRHTFVGHGETLNEFHWTAAPDSARAITEVPLRDFAWLSGVIMVPPGTWPR